MATIAWDRLLETFYKRKADVALLTLGSPPLLRVEESWRSLQVCPLEIEDVKALAAEILRPKPDAETDGYVYSDFWYGDVVFFRAMAFGIRRQRCSSCRLPRQLVRHLPILASRTRNDPPLARMKDSRSL